MREHIRPARRRSRSRTAGQALLLFVLAFTVLVGFTGLSVDVGHAYVAHRQTQDATDAAALAGGRQLVATGVLFTSGPPSPKNGASCCSAVVTAAHDYATQNGYPTTLNESCENNGAVQLDETWFNAGFAGSCAATSGYATKVEFHIPPIFAGGEPPPPDCGSASPSRFNCVQVIITSLISNYFLSALGFPSQYTVTKATAFALPPNATIGLPIASAVYLYQPQAGCNSATQQCFNDSAGALAPSRSQLSCTGGNCPTFWTQSGTKPSIYGFDGSTSSPAISETPTVQSSGDMVINDDTTFCDPYSKGATWCASGPSNPAGAQGYSAKAGSLMFCQAQGGATYPQTAPATPNTCSANPAAGWPGVKHVNGSGAAFVPCSVTCSWVLPTGTAQCKGLVLNGETVQSHYNVGDPCYPGAGDEYTLLPGKYPYIVINHGQYFFDSGVFEITSSAPVNTKSGKNYTADGIDHGNEGAADFDLCTGGGSCPNLTAGVWIGHGKGSFTDAGTGGSGSTCAGGGGGGAGAQAGGGDQTVVSGSGVTFALDAPNNPGNSNGGTATTMGMVVTNEVQSVNLAAPGASQTQLPFLIQEDNNSFIHLDGQHGSGSAVSGYSGIVYQAPSATGGGVELDPGTGGNQTATLQGQVLAYSFTTFGTQGRAVDFSGGEGANGGLSISSSGHAESSIIVSNNASYSPRKQDNGDGTTTFSLDYTDEWALDAFDTYIKINSGSPIFFSQNEWSCPAPGCGNSLPPTTSVPGDNSPQRHHATADAGYALGPGRPGPGNLLQGTRTVAASDDWVETLALSGKTYTFETLGNWTWGHEHDPPINTTLANPNLAEINLTFPTPSSGTSFTLSIFMEDGDHCGDYASAQFSFPLSGGGGVGGSGTGTGPGGVQLEE